jgi:hypothetical protein
MNSRYLDQLGMASKYNTKVYCRQSLIGGSYGLLNTTTFVPRPDYYRQEAKSIDVVSFLFFLPGGGLKSVLSICP